MTTTQAIPTLDQLNELSASKTILVLLRTLNTSDFVFHYMLYKHTTLKDIIAQAESLLHLEVTHEDGDVSGLSEAEKTEFFKYMADMQEYMRTCHVPL